MAGSRGIPEAMTTQVRGRVAHYRIVRQLGEGGMGVVLLARDEALGRQVALKLLSPRFADDVQFRARFVRESRLAAAIDHPNIIPIFEAGEANGQLFIAMRYVAGTDLRELLLTDGALLPSRAIAIGEQVARALDAAHNAGVVHRDVKPGNVMIDASEGREHCYLTDFGLTKNMSSSSGYTETGQFVGTLNYMAPEQIEGRKVDARADQYALACVLFECLAGVPPFRRDSDVAMMFAHLHEPPPSICAMRHGLPSGVDAVLARALAKAPADRYASCCAMIGELRSALAGATMPAFSPSSNSTGRRFSRPATVPPPPPVTPSNLPTRGRPDPYFAPVPPPVAPAPAPATMTMGEAEQRSYLRAALILAVAIVLCAGGIAAALIAKSGSGGTSQPSAAQMARRQLLNRTIRLNKEIVMVSRKVEQTRGKTDQATKARLQRDLAEAKAIAAQARSQQVASAAGTQALTTATAKLTAAVKELLQVAKGQNTLLAKLHRDLTAARHQINAASSGPGLPAVDTPPVSAPVPVPTGAPVKSVTLPGDAATKVVPPSGRSITSAVDVGDLNGDGQRDFGFVTNASDAMDPRGYVVLGGQAGEIDLGSLSGAQGFEVTGATALAPAGDVSGDQVDDLAAVGPVDATTGAGSVYVVYGKGNGDSLGPVDLTTGSADLQIDLPAGAGTSTAAPQVHSAGDVNGDSTGDLVIGDPAANSGKGGAWVVLGSDQSRGPVSLDPIAPADGFAITGDEGDGFGGSVSSADVNNDLKSDVIVGAPHASGGGAAFVVYGTGAPADVNVDQLSGGQGFAIRGTDSASLTGTVVAGLDDMNGDGNAEVLVTAPGASPQGRTGAGAAYVVFGPGSGASDIPLDSLGSGGYEIDGPVAAGAAVDPSTGGFGSVAAPAGNINADGTPDVVIGSPLSAAGPGLAFVVYGKPDSKLVDLASPTPQALPIQAPGATTGGPLTIAGGADLDGDGRTDVLVGPIDSSAVSAPVYAVSGDQP
jgi:serine/threonine protein kinase